MGKESKDGEGGERQSDKAEKQAPDNKPRHKRAGAGGIGALTRQLRLTLTPSLGPRLNTITLTLALALTLAPPGFAVWASAAECH